MYSVIGQYVDGRKHILYRFFHRHEADQAVRFWQRSGEFYIVYWLGEV